MKVSVLMLAYNHEEFLAQALNSVLMQEVNFDYEIIIGEDCSSDSTRNILMDFLKKNPKKIKALFHDENIGMHHNFARTLAACSGEYIAILEADDYWTHHQKLQKQVDLMDSDNSISECFHKVTTIHHNSNNPPSIFPSNLKRKTFEIKDVISEFFIPTLSVVFRRTSIPTLPESFYEMSNPDWLIHIMCAQKGRIAFINEVMGTYRVHDGGIWSSNKRSQILEKTIKSTWTVNRYLNHQHTPLLIRRIMQWHIEAIKIHLKDLEFIPACKHGTQLISTGLFLIFKNLQEKS